MENIKVGLQGELKKIVKYEDTAAALGNGNIEVFSTPMMVCLMEFSCVEAVKEFIKEGYGTVGMSLDISHLAPTPVGMQVKAKSELIEVDGKKLTFKVEAYDEKGKIGEGVHKRAIINLDKFLGMIKNK